MELTLSDILRMFKRWKTGFLLVFFLTPVLTVLVYRILPKEYEVSAVLRISGSAAQQSLMGISLGKGGETPDDYIEMMKSRRVMERVIEKYDLVKRLIKEKDLEKLRSLGYTDDDVVEILYRKLREGIDISTLGKSSLISISYRSKDPKVSYDVVSGVVEEFQSLVEEITGQNVRKKRGFLEKKLEESYRNFREKLQELVEFQKKYNVISPQDELAALKERYMDTLVEILSNKIALLDAENELKGLTSEFATIQPLQDFSNILDISGKIADLESQLAALRVSYSDDHVKVRTVKAQIDFLKSRLEDLKKRIVENPVDFSSLSSRLAGRFWSIKDLELGIKTGEKILGEISTKMNDIFDLEEKYSFLQTELNVLQGMISFTWQQYLSTLLDEISIVSKVNVISPPKYTNVPKKLSTMLVGAVGGALGIFLGILFVFWRESSHPKLTDHIIFSREMEIEGYGVVRRKRSRGDVQRIVADMRKKSGKFLVLGASEGEGKSWLSTEISRELSKLGKKVLLVDGDLGRKEVSKRLGIERSEGLVKMKEFDVLVPSNLRDLSIPDGYDIVLIDSPSFDEAVIDVSLLEEKVDGIVLVLAEMVSTRSTAQELIGRYRGKIEKVIFTNVRWLS